MWKRRNDSEYCWVLISFFFSLDSSFAWLQWKKNVDNKSQHHGAFYIFMRWINIFDFRSDCGMLSLLILAHIILFAHANTQNANKSPKEKLYRIKYFYLHRNHHRSKSHCSMTALFFSHSSCFSNQLYSDSIFDVKFNFFFYFLKITNNCITTRCR